MPQNLTGTDAFTDPVPCIDDGDPASGANFALDGQALANRTTWLKNRIAAHEQFAEFAITGTALAMDAKFTMTESIDPSASYSVTSTTDIEVPAAGYYEITVAMGIQVSGSGDPGQGGVQLFKGAVSQVIVEVWRYAATDDQMQLHITKLVQVTTPASERISLKAYSATDTTAYTNAFLSIKRLS